MAKAKQKKHPDNEQFGEYIPAYMQNELFPAEDTTDDKPRSAILKSLGIVFGLLLVQVLLFFLLITFTLGFSL